MASAGFGRALAEPQVFADPAVFVQALLDTREADLDFARAKLEIDHFVDPSIDIEDSLSEIESMIATVGRMLATIREDEAETSAEKLNALRAFVYEPGWWNDNRPFRYDLNDPYGQDPNSQLLTRYLETRLGNCVSIPILFLILRKRLGLDMTLSTAPLHVFVKYTDDDGRTWNLEPTSGAGFTRDVWYRRKTPMTEQAIANGIYLKTLSRREALAVMATTILDHLMAEQRYEEAIALTDVLIEAWPAYAYTHVKKSTAYYRLLEAEIIRKYPNANDMPPEKIERANMLYRANLDAFRKAEELGWREPELN